MKLVAYSYQSMIAFGAVYVSIFLSFFYIFGAYYHNKAKCRRLNVYKSRFGGIFYCVLIILTF